MLLVAFVLVTGVWLQALRADEAIMVTDDDVLMCNPSFYRISRRDAGNALPRGVAQRLTGVVRASDTACRLAGDTFTVIAEEVQALCERVRGVLGAPIQFGERARRLGSSIGVALYPDHTDSAPAPVRCADGAMYAAKHTGGGWQLGSVLRRTPAVPGLAVPGSIALAGRA